MKKFDVVIAGGGLSGALTALHLAQLVNNKQQRLSIAIVEMNALRTEPSLTYDDRVLALAHGSADYLQSVGVWPLIEPYACAIKHIHVSDRGYYGKARLMADDYHVSALGYVTELSVLGHALMTQLQQYQNVHWYSPDSIQSITWHEQNVAIELASGIDISTPLLLGCDGAQSKCRQLSGIQAKRHEYHQNAVIANITLEKPHKGKAFERFTEFGPLAVLPLSKGRCSLVWTLTEQQAEQAMQWSDEQFVEQLQQAFGYWLGAITQVGKRSMFPLSLVQTERNTFHRMALIGNASHTIHPIAGQGFNLGLRDVKTLVQLIESAWNKQQDIGAFSLLENYQQQRRTDQQQVIQFTDSLVTLFSNQLPPLTVGRTVALKAINYLSPLKKMLATKTMGY